MSSGGLTILYESSVSRMCQLGYHTFNGPVAIRKKPEERTKEFVFLYHGQLLNMVYGGKIKVLKMCNTLKGSVKPILNLLQNNAVKSDDFARILKGTLRQLKDTELIGYVKSMLKKTNMSKIKLILSFPDHRWHKTK